jgi:hypothetical protein
VVRKRVSLPQFAILFNLSSNTPAKNLTPLGKNISSEESSGEELFGEEFSGEECSANQFNIVLHGLDFLGYNVELSVFFSKKRGVRLRNETMASRNCMIFELELRYHVPISTVQIYVEQSFQITIDLFLIAPLTKPWHPNTKHANQM